MRLHQLLFVAASFGGTTTDLSAQIRASEQATISQTIDGTEIRLEYARPRTRGRDSVFGGEVKWNEVWTPGANWATTLELNRDIKLDGHPVPKGKYSVWLVVKQSGPWTMVLDPRSRLFHMAHVDSTAEQIRYPVMPEAGPVTDVLTWSFPEIRVNGGTMAMQWGAVRVPFRIEVTPSYNLLMTAAKAAPYLGRYNFEWTEKSPADSIPMTLTVSYRDTVMVGEWLPELWPGAGPVIMVPIKDDWFIPAHLAKGEIYDIDKDMVLEFARRKQGQKTALTFEVRGTGDSLWATGKRK
jgi:hypothetical protein